MSFQSEARGRRAEAWIGLAHVRPRPGNEILEGAVGAFVPALALASGPKDFVNKVTAKLDTYELDVVEIMDIERCESRFAKQSVSDNIKMLADSLREDNPIKLDAFQTYIKE